MLRGRQLSRYALYAVGAGALQHGWQQRQVEAQCAAKTVNASKDTQLNLSDAVLSLNVTQKKEKAAHLENFAILSGSTNGKLTRDICNIIGTTPADVDVTRFSDGEVSCVINESIRGKDVFCVQSCAAPVNDSIIELLLTVTALRRSGAASITAVIPYFGYKFHRRRGLPISTTYQSRFLWNAAGDVAKMLAIVGVDKVVSVDLQRPGQGHEACFFDGTVPTETISTADLFVTYFADTLDFSTPTVIVSPASEYVKKAKKFERKLRNHPDAAARNNGVPPTVSYAAFLETETGEEAWGSALPASGLVLLDAGAPVLQRKPPVGSSAREAGQVLGDVRGCNVVIIDDVVDTTGSLPVLTRRLIKEGAKRVYICATHGVLSESSMEIINLLPVERIVITDSLPLPRDASSPKIVQASAPPLSFLRHLLPHSNFLANAHPILSHPHTHTPLHTHTLTPPHSPSHPTPYLCPRRSPWRSCWPTSSRRRCSTIWGARWAPRTASTTRPSRRSRGLGLDLGILLFK